MRVFLSYASEDRDLAEQVQLALAGASHEVFFDRNSLPAGGDYHARIRNAVDGSDTFVFLVTRSSVQPGSYALTELKYARKKWPHPVGRVLPVRIGDVPWDMIPGYLKAVSVLEPEGNVAAEVLAALADLRKETGQAGAGTGASSPDSRQEQLTSHKRLNWRNTLPLLVFGLAVVLVPATLVDWGGLFSGTPGGTAAATRDTATTRDTVAARDTVAGMDPPTDPQDAKEGDSVPVGVKQEAVEVPLEKRALAISMIHETGRPRKYTAVYARNDQIMYGQSFVTLHEGSLYTLLRTYSETRGARFAGQMKEYLPRLERRDTSLIKDTAFTSLLVRAAGEDSIMVRLQDENIDRFFFDPARKECADIGIRSPLGFALIADTFLNSGRSRYERIKLATIQALDGTPATGINEKRWLRRFAEERIASFANHRFKDYMKERTNVYLQLMEDNEWDLAAPVRVGRFVLVDP